jgi:hypothetical protein
MTKPKIQVAVHQCVLFCENLKMSYDKAEQRIAGYLKQTKDEKISMAIEKSKRINCFADADFERAFKKEI